MIDSKECSSMAMQADEEAAWARQVATGERHLRRPNRADRWDRIAAALNDAAEAFRRAGDELDGVSAEKG